MIPSHLLIEDIFQNLPMPVALCTPSADMVYTNKAFALIAANYEAQENIVHYYRQLITQEGCTALQAALDDRSSAVIKCHKVENGRQKHPMMLCLHFFHHHDTHTDYAVVMEIPLGEVLGHTGISHRSFAGYTVLLVEDNTTNQQITAAMLEEMGVKCVVVGDGDQAVLAVKEQYFDLILMDINMPHKRGQEAARDIRRWEEQTRQGPVPIIALTGYEEFVRNMAYLEATINDYLRKPVSYDTLYNKLDMWLPQLESSSGIPTQTKTHTFASTTPLVNEKILSETLAMVGAQAKRFVDSFIQDTETHLDQLDQLLQNHQYDQLHDFAHSLKSAAGYLGCEALVVIASDIEHKTMNKIYFGIEALITNLREEFTKTKAYLLEYVDVHKAG